MTDMTNSGVALAGARRSKTAYQSLFKLVLIIEALAAIFVLIKPRMVLDFLKMSHIGADDWIRVVAGFVLLLFLYQYSAQGNPVHDRRGNVISVVGRFGMAILFICFDGTFMFLGLFELATAILLYLAYRKLVISELQTRP